MIKTGHTLLGFLALVLFTGAAWSQEPAADRLAETLKSYSTFQATFTQVVADEEGQVVQETTGSLKAKRPGLFYWETDPPENQFLVSNGDTVELYDPDLEQVTVQDLDEQISTTPALLLSGETEGLSDTYEISEERYGDHTREYTLVPRSEDSLFTSLTLTFYDDELQAMRLEDSLAQRTELEFGSITINESIEDDAFRLDYPDTADVIKSAE